MTSKHDADTTGEPTPETTESDEPRFTPPYLGKIVYLEHADPNGKSVSTHYYDGSYLVLDETSGELFTVPLRKIDVHDVGEPKPIPLVGAMAARILAVDPPTKAIVAALDGIIAEAYAVLSGARTGNWINSVYERAYVRARQARNLVAGQLGLPPNPNEPTFSAPAKAAATKATAPDTASQTATVVDLSAQETRALLEPLVDLLKPLTLAGASAELHVVFPAATNAEQKAEADRRAATRRLGEAIIATSLHPDNR